MLLFHVLITNHINDMISNMNKREERMNVDEFIILEVSDEIFDIK